MRLFWIIAKNLALFAVFSAVETLLANSFNHPLFWGEATSSLIFMFLVAYLYFYYLLKSLKETK